MTHTFPGTSPHWYDVKLAVSDGNWSYYHQAVAVQFQPTLYPATPDPREPAPPATGPCGDLTTQQQAAVAPQARSLVARLGGATTQVYGSKS